MTPEFYLCDICNKKCPKEHRTFVASDRVSDAAGDMDDEGKHVDICGECAFKALNHLYIHNENRIPNYQNGTKLLNYIRERAKKNGNN